MEKNKIFIINPNAGTATAAFQPVFMVSSLRGGSAKISYVNVVHSATVTLVHFVTLVYSAVLCIRYQREDMAASSLKHT